MSIDTYFLRSGRIKSFRCPEVGDKQDEKNMSYIHVQNCSDICAYSFLFIYPFPKNHCWMTFLVNVLTFQCSNLNIANIERGKKGNFSLIKDSKFVSMIHSILQMVEVNKGKKISINRENIEIKDKLKKSEALNPDP